MTTDERFDRIDAAFGGIKAAIERLSQTTAERFDRMDARFDGIDKRLDRMDGRFDRMDARFDGIDKRLDRMDERFDRMDARFDGIDKRLDRMDERFDRMDARFDGIDKRLDRMDERFDGMDARIDRVDASIERLSEHTATRFEALTDYLQEFRVETITRLDVADSRSVLITTTLASIDPNSRLPTLTKGVMDLGAAVSKFGIELWKQKDDFGNRLTKLEETVAKLHNPAA